MNKFCEICGKRMASEKHHLLFGRGIRPLADSDAITKDICAICHNEIHTNPTAGDLSKICGQLMWELDAINDGADPHEVRNKFRERYGRSWI